VLEVSNTPWHERHSYVVGPPGAHTFAKAMHVSPFLPAEGTYSLRYSAPEEGIRVSLDVAAPPPVSPYGRGDEPDCDIVAPRLSASMVLQRRPLNRAGLARLLWAYPLMTTRVSSGIYAQAVRLAARGTPFHRHPDRRDVAPSPAAIGDDMVRSGYGSSR
jgi:DUF1365 family protein